MSKIGKALVGIAAITAIAFTGGAALMAGGWASAGTFLTQNVAGRLLTSVALSALSQAMMKTEGQKSPGIRSSNTGRGDVNPDGFVLGRYATAGTAVVPPYTHSRSGHKTPNPYLQYVIHLGSAPGQQLEGMLIDGRTTEIVGEEIPWDGNTDFGKSNDWTGKRREYGREVKIDGSDATCCWVRFYDGTQTEADGRLVNRYGRHRERPWTADMVGTGTCYAIVTFQLDSSVFSGFPQVQFILTGIPLYDPRRDSSVGGNGSHRWGIPPTYTVSANPAVQIYNLLRGIRLPGGQVYGGSATAAQLPVSSWFAAMNACDAPVALEGGGTEPAWRTSYEVSVADEPAAVIEELCSAASIQLTEMGGTWKIRVGGPGVPVAWLTDDDIMTSHDETFELFPGLDQTFNGASVSGPDPESGWQAVEGPLYRRSDYEAQDQGRQLVADLSLPAAPYPLQNQRLARAYVEEERRFRRHIITLPPDYGAVEPLDTIAWSSIRNGYEDKLFEVVSTTTDPVTQLVAVALRERDPADYDWEPGFQLPYTPQPPIWSGPVEVEVGGFTASDLILTDAEGNARRPAIALAWNADDLEDVDGLEWELRLSSSADIQLRGSISDVGSGRLVIAEGILADTSYLVRARMVGKAFSNLWSGWIAVTTPDVRLTLEDMAEELKDDIRAIAAEAGIETVEELPASGRPDQILLKLPESVLYRWDAETGEWVTAIYAGIPDGSIDQAKIAQGLVLIRNWTGAALPTTRQGDTLSWNGRLYVWNGSRYESKVPAVDVTGQLTNDQIAALAAAKLTGQITNSQIADGALSLVKFATGIEPVANIVGSALPTTKSTTVITFGGKLYRWSGSAYVASVAAIDITGTITNAQIAGLAASKVTGQITSTQISDSAITTPKVAAGAIETAQLAAGAIVADKIAAGAVTAGKIDALAVTSDKIAADAITAAKISAGAVGADQIAANVIAARHLVIADYSNPLIGSEIEATSNFVPDGSGGAFSATTTLNGKATSLRISGAGAGGFRYRNNLNVAAGEEYHVSLWAYRNAGWNGVNSLSKLRFGDANGGAHIWSLGYGASELPANSWRKLEGSFVVPQGVTALTVLLGNDATTSYIYLSDLEIRRKNGGELIVDGAITAAKVRAGSIEATALAAGSVVADKIAAGAVTAPKIDAGAVTTSKLDALAVTAEKIAANAITAAKISAGAVGADQIAANAISGKHILVADFENAILDPDYTPENAGAWGWIGDATGIGRAAAPSPMIRPWSLTLSDRISGGTGVRVPPSTPIPCKPGEQWRTSMAVRPTGNWPRLATMAFIAYFYTAPNVSAALNPASSPNFDCTNVARIEIDHTFTIPEGVSYVSFGYVRRSSPAQNGMVHVNEMSARRLNGGELIVDGAITANKVSTGAITADAIAASAIIASKIAAGAVTADKINVGNLSAITATIGVLRTRTSGSRLEIRDDVILIYEGNTLVGEIGKLDR